MVVILSILLLIFIVILFQNKRFECEELYAEAKDSQGKIFKFCLVKNDKLYIQDMDEYINKTDLCGYISNNKLEITRLEGENK